MRESIELLPLIDFHPCLGPMHLSTILPCLTVELVDTGLQLFGGQVNKNDAS
jgi:hypothetical protein